MNVSVIVLPILILLALALGVLVYYICYKAAINRKLREEESGAHVPMASVESVWKVVAVIAVIVMYSSLNSKIVNLQNELIHTRNNLSNEISELQYQLYEMQEAAKREASMVSAVEFDFGEIDTKEHTAKMYFRVVPKSYSPETELSLVFMGEKVLLTNDGSGTFTGSSTVSMFEEIYEDGMICITEGGVTKTEVWEEVPKGGIFFECLPQLGIMSSTFGYHKGKGTVKLQGDLQMMSSEKEIASFRDLIFCVKNEGNVIDELPMENGYIKIDQGYPSEKGDSYEFYVRGVDEYGYIHEMFVTGWNSGEDSETHVHGFEPYGYQVYAPDGTPLIK